ncbi:hypothetical protein JOE60_001204 [Paenarthrobacter ilicis]|nr:hypothetical protein [Paenarthrobacter ilicis]
MVASLTVPVIHKGQESGAILSGPGGTVELFEHIFEFTARLSGKPGRVC